VKRFALALLVYLCGGISAIDKLAPTSQTFCSREQSSRLKEMAIRTALGASRLRVCECCSRKA